MRNFLIPSTILILAGAGCANSSKTSILPRSENQVQVQAAPTVVAPPVIPPAAEKIPRPRY